MTHLSRSLQGFLELYAVFTSSHSIFTLPVPPSLSVSFRSSAHARSSVCASSALWPLHFPAAARSHCSSPQGLSRSGDVPSSPSRRILKSPAGCLSHQAFRPPSPHHRCKTRCQLLPCSPEQSYGQRSHRRHQFLFVIAVLRYIAPHTRGARCRLHVVTLLKMRPLPLFIIRLSVPIKLY